MDAVDTAGQVLRAVSRGNSKCAWCDTYLSA